MARGATYPRAYRRVRACVFRRMPTQGGTSHHGLPRRSPTRLPWRVRLASSSLPRLRMVQVDERWVRNPAPFSAGCGTGV